MSPAGGSLLRIRRRSMCWDCPWASTSASRTPTPRVQRCPGPTHPPGKRAGLSSLWLCMHSRASTQFRRRPRALGPGHQGLLPRREPQVSRGWRDVAAHGVPEAGRQGTPSLPLLSLAPDWRCSSRFRDPRAALRTRSGAYLQSEGCPRRCLRWPSAIHGSSLCCALQGGGEELRKCTRVGMIAGGTGITPMLQIITAVLKDKGDKTEVLQAAALPRMQRLSMCASLHPLHLALAAVRQPDGGRHLVPQRACACAAPVNVLQLNWRTPAGAGCAGGEAQQFEGACTLLAFSLCCVAQANGLLHQVHYTLDRPPASWAFSTGFISADMVQKHLPPAGSGTQVCGAKASSTP